MDLQTDILTQNGIVAAKAFSGLDALINGGEPSAASPPSLRTETWSLADEADELDVDPRLAAYWLWEYGAATPVHTADEPMSFYVPLVAARDDGSLVEGTDYIGEAELRDYLGGAIANDNWLVRRLK